MKRKKVRALEQILSRGDPQIREEKMRKSYAFVFQADNTANVHLKWYRMSLLRGWAREKSGKERHWQYGSLSQKDEAIFKGVVTF